MTTHVFKIGDSIKVKPAILCPDDESVCLGGWQGRIIEIEDEEEQMIDIEWDSTTLKGIPIPFIADSEKEGLGWWEMRLCASDVEPVAPRESAVDTETFRDGWASKFHWLGEGKQGERIFRLLDADDDPDDEFGVWNDHLAQVLKFPFEAKVAEPQDRGSLACGDRIQVHQFAEVDDVYGILVNATKGKESFVFPLCDLNALDKKSANYTPMRDYCVWFANR